MAEDVLIVDDPLLEPQTPEQQAKARELWNRWMIKRQDGEAIFVGRFEVQDGWPSDAITTRPRGTN